MKQRIRVVGIIKNEDGTLVFKRNRGRSESPVFWELPTGKIKFGEQPEEAMVRTLSEYADLTVSSIQIRDVITFLAPEGARQLSNLYIVFSLTVTGKPNPRDRYTAFKYIKDFANSGIHLNEASMSVIEIEDEKTVSDRVNARDTANSVVVNVDGASRGNPGPSGIGYVIHDERGTIIEKGGEFIGFATSRMAEYYAMRKGVERAIELGFRSVRFISDSLMVINQLSGIFSVKNPDITPVYKDILEKISQFEAVSFKHVPRSENSLADHEANAAIDKMFRK